MSEKKKLECQLIMDLGEEGQRTEIITEGSNNFKEGR